MRMRAVGEHPDGIRLRRVIVMPWRAGLRISESASALTETDLDVDRGAVMVRAGKGGRRREVGSTAGPSSTIPTRWLCRPGAESGANADDRSA